MEQDDLRQKLAVLQVRRHGKDIEHLRQQAADAIYHFRRIELLLLANFFALIFAGYIIRR